MWVAGGPSRTVVVVSEMARVIQTVLGANTGGKSLDRGSALGAMSQCCRLKSAPTARIGSWRAGGRSNRR